MQVHALRVQDDHVIGAEIDADAIGIEVDLAVLVFDQDVVASLLDGAVMHRAEKERLCGLGVHIAHGLDVVVADDFGEILLGMEEDLLGIGFVLQGEFIEAGIAGAAARAKACALLLVGQLERRDGRWHSACSRPRRDGQGSPSMKLTPTSMPMRGMVCAPKPRPAQGWATRIQQELVSSDLPLRSQWNLIFTRP